MNPKFQKAISLFKKKDFDEAKNICEEILEIETKNYDLSVELISKAVKINSNNAEAYNNLGIAFKKLNKFDSALESWNLAI